MAIKNTTSNQAGLHPYQRADFWLNDKNHFWETDMYTEQGKSICRERIDAIKEKTYAKSDYIFGKTNGVNPKSFNT